MSRVSSTGWAMAPWPLLDQLAEPGGKQRLAVYLWLHRYGHGRQEGCWASIQTIATKCGIKPAHVKDALRWLLEAGWIERISRPGQTSFYFVKADAPQHNLGPKKDPGTKKAPPTRGPKGTQVPKRTHDPKESSLPLTSRDPKETPERGSTALQAAPSDPGAHPLQPNLLPSETPVAKPGSKAKRRPRLVPLPIPAEFAEFSGLIEVWLQRRKANGYNLDPWEPGARSAGALRLAIAKGVAVPYLENAADKGWDSLGYPGHKDKIELLASPSAPRSNRWAPPEAPVLQDYKPGRR